MKKSTFPSISLISIVVIATLLFTACLNPNNDDPAGSGYGTVSGYALLTNQSDHSGITITMEAVTSLQTSAVRDAVAGSDAPEGGTIGASAVYAQTVTGTDGSFLLQNVLPGTYTVYASYADSLECAVAVNVVVEANTTLTVDDLYLTPAGSVSGIALLSGVAAGSHQGIIVYLAGTSYIAVTDGSGNYEITGVPEGTGYTLVASMYGYANSSQTVSVAPLVVTEPAPITLTPGSSSDASPPVIKSVTHIPQPARVNSPTAILVDAQDPESILTLSYDTDSDGQYDDDSIVSYPSTGTYSVSVKATSDGGTATATHQITVSTALPDQTTPQIQSITHTPLEVHVGEEVTIIVAVVPDDFTPTITYDTDNDGTFDDPDTVTFTSSGIKSVEVRVETAGGATQQTHYIYVLPPGAGYLTISGAAATSDTTPTWTWNVPTEATNFRYRLDRIGTPNVEIVAWAETGGTGTTSYTSAVTLTVGESYLFTVQGYDGADWSYEASRTTLITEASTERVGDYFFSGTDVDVDIATWTAGGYTSITGNLTVDLYSWSGAAITNLDFLAGLTSIGGNLTIRGTDDLVSLSGLDSLVEVRGGLYIGNSGYLNYALLSLTGLEALESVGGSLSIYYNPYLQDITALSALQEVGGGITILEDDDLLSLAGLQNLNCAVTSLSIDNNDMLQDISSLAGITVNGVTIRDNPDLLSLSGLTGVRGINASITIEYNDSLTTLSGLDSLGYVTYDVTVTGNDDLETLDGLGITGLGRYLTVSGNASLADISELSDITILSAITISDNDSLPDLAGLENISYVSGAVNITQNEVLANLSAIDLTGVGGTVTLSDNGSNGVLLDYSGGGCSFGNISGSLNITGHHYLQSLNGIHVDDCLGDLVISGNDALTNLGALSTLTRAANLSVHDNPVLASLDGLDSISVVSGYVTIYSNVNMNDLSALSGLHSGGDFRIYSLPNLTDFTAGGGLNNLRIDGTLHIGYYSGGGYYGNSTLESLDGLTGLELNTTGNSGLRIQANPTLADISALNGMVTDLTTQLYIYDNDSLVTLSGLDTLTSTGSLYIQYNDQLTDLTALGALTGIPGSLYLEYNSNLESLAGLQGITHAYALYVTSNSALVELGSGAEETDITLGVAATFTSGDYFTFHDGSALYDVWFNVNSGGGAPSTGHTPIEVAVATGETAATIADNTATAIAASAAGGGADVYVDSWDEVVYLMNAAVGTATDAAVTQSGTGISPSVSRQGAAAGTGLVNLNSVDYNLTIGSNATMETLGLAGMNGDSMNYMYITGNPSLNQGKALRFYERNSRTNGGDCSGNKP